MNHFFLFLLFSSLSVIRVFFTASAREKSENPFTPKGFLIRYWENKISNKKLPIPQFLLSKASPLSAVECATFSKLAANHTLSTRLTRFCISAHLLCSLHDSDDILLANHTNKDANFAVYNNKNFTNYGTGRLGGLDSFKNYSDNARVNIPINDFRQYSRNSTDHNDDFFSYGSFGNFIEDSFHNYSAGSTAGASNFNNYAEPTNGDNKLRFSSYSDAAKGRSQSFTRYSENGNSGDQAFTGYGQRGNDAKNSFESYGTSSNPVVTGFSRYGKDGVKANDTFKNYANHGNGPTNTFKTYGDGGSEAIDRFDTYRVESNAGSDAFQNYAKGSNGANVDFTGYDQSDNSNSDKFTGYGNGAERHRVGFASYRINSTFAEYAKEGVTFSRYNNLSDSGSMVKKRVEEGKFFRESMLKQGTVMAMPDIRDKMPERSFLPRAVLSKLPFTVSEVNRVFKVGAGSSLEKIVKESVGECESEPSQGETKRCVGSIEDMVDFATGVLGPNVAVRTTENVNGSKGNVMVGLVNGINGGRVTESVSCHQSLFPYLLYYCHSVPKVRVYEADLLDPNSKAKINHGVAICHLDTSSWSPSHGAFLALGSGPGRIEVCHWIFENDMTWTIAD
ncbi:polygalacturonase 1 beta-like protein 2 isoform X2 [Gastrolobium bilobum]|uniref:polygalacturonase 1 beta-like protein 2 isoform X2 n=1 Tax=Gastrolobium bilobum TaxID=150636 RepID=UPI002AB18587|nr:polygalacturonase 1 beta-like protein 2 isoform X2 [Gastrolobium bilobum]